MKEFTKYTFYLTLTVFISASVLFFILSVIFLINGIVASNEVLQDSYIWESCMYGLLSIALFVFGFILTSIIHLLRHIAYKDEK